jgi:hypothetical protein
MRFLTVLMLSILAQLTTAVAQDRSQFTCSQSARSCAQVYPKWAQTKCPQAAAQCNKSPLGNGFCQFTAPDGNGSGARRCG